MTYRAAVSPATALGALLAAWAWSLGALLLARAVGWPVAFPAFVAYLGGAILLALGFAFAYSAYAGLALRYVVEDDALIIKLGPLERVIPLSEVERVVPGYALPPSQVRGASWWGLHLGRARLGAVAEAIVYSTHHRRDQLLYLVTPSATFAISPQQPSRLTRAMQLHPGAGASPTPAPGTGLAPAARRQWPAPAIGPFWQDRSSKALVLMALGLNLALFGFLFAVLPSLPEFLPLGFPPGLGERLGSRDEVLELPLVALVVLAINTPLALLLHARERVASYLLLGSAAGLQVLLWAATAAAVA